MKKHLLFFAVIIGQLVLFVSPVFTQVSEYSEDPITMPEIWIVDNQQVKVRGTVITGKALLAVHVLVDYLPRQNEATEQLARNISRYAVLNGYLENAMKYNLYSSDFLALLFGQKPYAHHLS